MKPERLFALSSEDNKTIFLKAADGLHSGKRRQGLFLLAMRGHRIFIVFFFSMILLLPGFGRTDQLRVSGYTGLTGSMFPLPIDTKSTNLQPYPNGDYRAELSYFTGQNNGLFFGMEYDSHRLGYALIQTGNRPTGRFHSDEFYLLGEVGYWWTTSNSPLRIESTAKYGQGRLNFSSDSSGVGSMSTFSQIAEIRTGLVYPLSTGIKETYVDLMAGVSLYRKFVPTFTYNGVEYTEEDFQNQFFGIDAGIGFRF